MNSLRRTILSVLALAAGYFATGWLGLKFPVFGPNITLLWLPTGIAVAALLRCSFRCWPGIWLGALAVNISTGTISPGAAAMMATGNTCGPLVAAWMLRRIGFRPAFERHRDIVLLATGAAVGMFVTASVGVSVLTLAGLVKDHHIEAWLLWWAGDTMGVIFAAPLLLNLTRREFRPVGLHRVEFAAWLVITCFITWAVFMWNRGADGRPWAVAFVPLPLLAWAALRFGPVGTSIGLIVLSLGVTIGTTSGNGPLVRAEPVEGAVHVWGYMATSAVLGWLISAVHQGQLRAVNIHRVLERALGDVSLGVLLTGADRRITYANVGFTRLTGYTEQELIGRSCRLLQGPGTDPVVAQKLTAAVRNAGFFDDEILNYRKDGTAFWNALLISPVRDEQGELTGYFGVQRDVTERKYSELRSAGEMRMLEALASGAPLADVLNCLLKSFEELFPGMVGSVLLLDADGRHLRHGAAPGLPEPYCQAIDGIEIGVGVGSCGTTAFTGKATIVSDIEHDPLWKDFSALALSHDLRACWSVPILSSQNRVLGTFAMYYHEPKSPKPAELTAIERGAHFASLAIERHQLLQSLRDSQIRIETLVGNLPGMAYRCQNDRDWTMTYVSEGCEAVTGYRRDELESNRLTSYGALVHPEDREWLWEKAQAALSAGAPCHHEYRIIAKDGGERWVSERATGVRDPAGRLLYIDGFVQDITASRRARREREELDRKMQETQKLESLGVLAGGIAHDFNNLLTGIMGNASLARAELPPGSHLVELIEPISNSAARAADLCKQMLAYSGKGRFVIQKADLGPLVDDTAQMLRLSISKKADLRFQLEPGLPVIEADTTQIRQVIMNLVINASEALGENAGTITLSTGGFRVDSPGTTGVGAGMPVGEYVFLKVTDTGCGMDAATKAKIFEPFFTTKFTGRGLGLAAVLGIVRGHKGALTVDSEPGRGTTFTVIFPAAVGRSAAARATTPDPSSWRGEGTVLIVDDEETVRKTVARMVRMLGFDSVLANDGQEAVEIFRADPARFKLVLLDLTMPRLGGEQTLIELRKLREDVRVVLMSGFNRQEALVRFSGKGVANFLQKPFTVESLRTVMSSTLA